MAIALFAASVTVAAADLDPTSYRRLETAQKALADGAFEHALATLQPLLDSPRSALARAIAHQLAAEAAIALDRPEAALGHLNEALAAGALAPAQSRFVEARIGYLELAAGRFEAAAAHLARAIDPARPDPALTALAALAEARAGRCEDALDRLSLGSAPPAPDARTWFEVKALCEVELGRLTAASKSLKALLALAPSDPNYWRQLVAVLQRAERYEDASAAYGAAREIVPLDGVDLVNFSRLLVYTGRPLEGAEVLAAGLADGRVPETAEHLTALADAYLLAREAAKAYPALERRAALGNGNAAEVYITLAEAARRFGDFERAVDAYEKALAHAGRPAQPALQLALGATAIHADREDLARRSLEAIPEDAPERVRADAWLRHLEARTARDDSGR